MSPFAAMNSGFAKQAEGRPRRRRQDRLVAGEVQDRQRRERARPRTRTRPPSSWRHLDTARAGRRRPLLPRRRRRASGTRRSSVADPGLSVLNWIVRQRSRARRGRGARELRRTRPDSRFRSLPTLAPSRVRREPGLTSTASTLAGSYVITTSTAVTPLAPEDDDRDRARFAGLQRAAPAGVSSAADAPRLGAAGTATPPAARACGERAPCCGVGGGVGCGAAGAPASGDDRRACGRRRRRTWRGGAGLRAPPRQAPKRGRARGHLHGLLRPDVERREVLVGQLRRPDDVRRDRDEDLRLVDLLLPRGEDLVEDRNALEPQDPREAVGLAPLEEAADEARLAVPDPQDARDVPRQEGRDRDGVLRPSRRSGRRRSS